MKSFLLVSLWSLSQAFTVPQHFVRVASQLASTTETENTDLASSKGLLKRDRYIATNRFAVRQGQAAKFEKRWASRQSRLAELPGFRYFHLMRRVRLQEDGTTTYDEGDTDAAAFENYVSFTVWQKKSDFSAWRNGEAFKEAHGGTSIAAFLSTMMNSALVLRGPPRPAFYDGLLMESTKPTNVPATVDGWRKVEADGVHTLPAECFVGLEKYFVLPDMMAAFEQFWAQRESTLSDYPGFVAFTLLRRDGQAKGHGMGKVDESEPNYVGAVIFENRSTMESWAATHGKESAEKRADAPAPPKMWDKAPEKIYYEGTLVISSAEGA